MISSLQTSSREQVVERIGRDGWLERQAITTAELLAVIDEITHALTAAHFSPKEIFGLRLALEEAGVNAIKHGHHGRQDKVVAVRYRVSLEEALFQVEDQGQGFDPESVPDPLAPENLERPSGRGLLLMRCYTTWLSYSSKGTCVTMCKKRSV
jgi:serine/threonine-protein kinase RsbW